MARTQLDDMQEELDDLDDYVDELRHKLDAALRELAEWRSGQRRILWRLRWKTSHGGEYAHDHISQKNARGVARYFRRSLDATKATVHRVTVKPKSVTS